MVSKMSAIAQRLGAVLMSDDGDIWTVTEDGRVLVDSPAEAPSEQSRNPPKKKRHYHAG